MKNVFVVGGCGFVGSHLVRRLLATPGVEKIRVYDNLSSGRIDNLPADRRIGFTQASARDSSALRAWMGSSDVKPDGYDTVFHLAANPDIARAVKEPTIDFEQGTVLTQNVLEAVRVNDVKRLIYFSGSGVYGENPDVAFREDYGPMAPISTYGASKLACEALICAYCHMFGLTARAFRFANIVGPRQTHGVGYDFLRKLKADPTRLVILGDGKQSKSYLHVDDALAAVMLVVERCICEAVEAPTPYAVYNVASGDSIAVSDIAKMAVAVVARRHASETSERCDTTLEYTGGDRGWKGDVPRVRFNCGLIHSLGWQAKRNSREAMQAALEAMAEEL